MIFANGLVDEESQDKGVSKYVNCLKMKECCRSYYSIIGRVE